LKGGYSHCTVVSRPVKSRSFGRSGQTDRVHSCYYYMHAGL